MLVEISSKQGNDGNDQYSIDVVHELEHSLNLDAMRGCGGEILSLKPSSSPTSDSESSTQAVGENPFWGGALELSLFSLDSDTDQELSCLARTPGGRGCPP